ncbi:albusnodin/ikarugamycin family macrolactam cyclase [Kribbella sp. NPDC056345]|uniref:albusnodin/ikarugamycin family macrolactam cyclase n=1 Tax=Kribbella sp. NPDC056345 TaxID=3345789 RepID=UPI0035DAFA50
MWIAGNIVDAAPQGGVEVWGGERSVWMVDTPAERWRAVTDDAGCRLLVGGDCYATDAELHAGLSAVSRGDWSALTLWPGSYWVAADDGHAQVVLTDVSGSRPVFFTPWQGTMAWATKAGPLAELVGAPLDLMAVVARMACPTIPEITGTETTYERVQRLPGGHALVIAAGELPRVVRYEDEGPIASFGDAVQDLRSALMTATAVRARSVERISADFSGGLDSTSLALLAARTEKRVLAATRDDPASRNDDIIYATRAAATTPNIEHLVVKNRTHGLFFDRLLDGPRTDQPFSDAARWSMRSVLHQKVLEAGTDLHLTGSGGDAVLTAPSTYLADLVRPGWIPVLLRHASARARLRHWPVAKVVKEAVRLSRVDQRQGLHQLADAIEQARPDDDLRRTLALNWYSLLGVAGWLSPDARKDLAARARLGSEKQYPGGCKPSVRRSWDELREFGTYQAELTAQLQATGIPAQAPMLDNAVVRACMSIAPHQLQSIAVQKPLLEAALRGLVPDFLLRRPTKGSYTGNAYGGVRRNITTLRVLLDHSVLASHGLLDRAAAQRHLARISAGVPGRFASLEALIATELWLQTTPQTRATWHRARVSTRA